VELCIDELCWAPDTTEIANELDIKMNKGTWGVNSVQLMLYLLLLILLSLYEKIEKHNIQIGWDCVVE
jgi:hypothetical protein